MMRPIVVFCGPTLAQSDASLILDAIYCPPAAQGDIVSAVQRFDPAVIVLIDGRFHSVPAVRHNEILWAVGEGVAVVGAASIGALRAAELHPSMEGVGLIYRWYRRHPLAPDDAVAVLHAPEELGSVPLTEAGINLRLTVRRALRTGAIALDLARRLDEQATRLNFRDRSLDAVIAAALADADDAERRACRAALELHHRDQKREDAIAALRHVKDGRYRSPSRRPRPLTRAFLSSLQDAGLNTEQI